MNKSFQKIIFSFFGAFVMWLLWIYFIGPGIENAVNFKK
jgi:hypothetical protein